MTTKIDRNSTSAARAVLEQLFPSDHERYAVLDRLLRSASAAGAVAPNSWAVTLFPNCFRLNVGQAEALVVAEPGFFLNCSASAGTPPFDTDASESTHYRSVVLPQCRYWGNAADLERLAPEVENAHLKFVELAARSPTGKPRTGTSFSKTHSPGLVAYAESFVYGRSNGPSTPKGDDPR